MAEQFTKYEVARILGARALQVAMDAPLLVKIDKEELELMRYDPLKIAEKEFSSNVLPITVKRPMPKKTETKLKRDVEKKVEVKVEEKKEDKTIENKEKFEEKEIKEEGEIMELAQPEDEVEEEATEEEGVE